MNFPWVIFNGSKWSTSWFGWCDAVCIIVSRTLMMVSDLTAPQVTKNNFDTIGMEIAGYSKSRSFNVQCSNLLCLSLELNHAWLSLCGTLHLLVPTLQQFESWKDQTQNTFLGTTFSFVFMGRQQGMLLSACCISIKTFSEWAWLHKETISDLDSHVVSLFGECFFFCFVFSPSCLWICWEDRFAGHKGNG